MSDDPTTDTDRNDGDADTAGTAGTDVDIAKGEGATPAMNAPGPKADEDRDESAPGNAGGDEPADEAPQSIEGAVRTDPDAAGSAAPGDEPALASAPEPNEPA